MTDALIRWSLGNRVLVLACAAAFLLWGGYAISKAPVDVLPDLSAPTVTVLVEGAGMAPAEMEALATFPIESALNGAAGVRRVRSATAVGVAVIWVEFDWGQDIQRARQTVTEKLNTVSGSLPASVERPFLAPVSSIMGEILFVSLESDRHSPLELRTIAETVVRRRLLAVPGVSQVIPTGGGQKQYQVLVDAQRLRAYHLTLVDVETALKAANRNSSAGFMVAGGQEYLIQGIGRVRTEEDIGRVVVASVGTRPILIRDLASVRIGEALKRAEGSHNAAPAVILGIQKQPGANTLELTRALDSTLDAIQRTLPPGMSLDRRIFRQADFIERALGNLEKALRDGSALVVIVVLVFLANLRAAAITLVAIPLSLVAAVLTMNFFGLTINSMSLGGLAIAIGELVDDAIIDVENVVRRLRENARKPAAERLAALEVVYRASAEIRGSVVFATIIVGLVFLPLFFLSSVEGRLLRPLGFAYVVALLASLLTALTVTPALCSLWLPAIKSEREPWLVRLVKRLYQPCLRWSIDHSGMVLGGSVLLLAAAVASYFSMGRAFLPEFNEGTLTISAVTLPGTSLAESDRLGSALERILHTVPEVASTARRTGRAELDEHVQGVESAEIDVDLKMKQRPKEAVLEDIRDKAALLPGMNVSIGQPISHRIDHMLSGTRANIAVKIFGDDLAALRALAGQVHEAMKGIPGVVDLAIEQQTDIPALRVKVDPSAAARYGVPAGAVTQTLRTAFAGAEAGQVFEGQLSFPLVVRYRGDTPSGIEDIARTQVDTSSGAKVPLSALAEIREDRGPNFIMREGVQRRIVVQCNVAGHDLRTVVNALRGRVATAVRFPPGYRVEYGGQFESEAAASQRLGVLGLLVIAGILLVLTTAFGSIRDALIIMLNLPLALAGGVVGVYLSGGVLSVASIIGFITLFGIATRNGIMLVSHIRRLREVEGLTDIRHAVLQGATERVSPILMTALAAGLALIPIALGMGKPGSEIQAPMALVILCGLLSSTALNMAVVPAAYLRYRA
ncbi:MAG: efflux RND transporter permease subunit [Candidatus Solibacter usitatus]|nr:efflux RND transporter permease subunit [Candidatus Solibacter usitatus]